MVSLEALRDAEMVVPIEGTGVALTSGDGRLSPIWFVAGRS